MTHSGRGGYLSEYFYGYIKTAPCLPRTLFASAIPKPLPEVTDIAEAINVFFGLAFS